MEPICIDGDFIKTVVTSAVSIATFIFVKALIAHAKEHWTL